MKPPYLFNHFNHNNSLFYYDSDGLIVGYIFVAVAAKCGLPYFVAAHMKYSNSQDKLKHCWTTCMIGRECRNQIAALAGLVFEDIIKDMEANSYGIRCAGLESWALLGMIGRWFRQSCYCCCKMHWLMKGSQRYC